MGPCADFDQTGFAWPRAPAALADALGQGQLFADNYAQPDAAASEPVFWTAPTRRDDQRTPQATPPPPERAARHRPCRPLGRRPPSRRPGVCLNLF